MALDRLVAEAVALANNSGFLLSLNGDANLSHTPFSLIPARVKAAEYHLSHKISDRLNRLTLDISGDHEFLRHTLAKTAEADEEFTGRLLRLLDKKASADRDIEFTINRFDFYPSSSADSLAAFSERSLHLVEMNCIAAGGLSQAGLISGLHRATHSHPSAKDAGFSVDQKSLPSNEILRESAHAFSRVHKEFCKLHAGQDLAPARMVMVVFPPFVNACDQDVLRWRMWHEYGIECVRLTLAEILEYGSLSQSGALIIEHCKGMSRFVVSVAYFRCAYMPCDYPSEKEWAARALLEKSTAVSCPSVGMQLVGTKRVQQALYEPGVLENFCHSQEDVELIRSCFVEQYALHGEKGGEAARLAINNPEGYVMKPQREGGGNNLYTEKMREALLSLDAARRGAYILMQRIYPTVFEGYMVRNGQVTAANMVCELGIYVSGIMVKGRLVDNTVLGHSMKSKFSTVDDGGIGAGVAVYDSPQLV